MGAASWFNVLVEWTGADIAGIVAAVVSVGGAIAAWADKMKAQQAAQQAAESQKEAARAQASMSRTAKLDIASRTGRMYLELVGENELRLTNPLSYTPETIELDCHDIENGPAHISRLGPLESKTVKLRELIKLSPNTKRFGSVFVSWTDGNGKRISQRWSFSDEN